MHSRLQCPTLIVHAGHSRRPRRQGEEEIFQRNEQRLPSGAPRGIGRRISLISACVPSYPTARALRKLTFSRLIRARASAHAIPATSSRQPFPRCQCFFKNLPIEQICGSPPFLAFSLSICDYMSS